MRMPTALSDVSPNVNFDAIDIAGCQICRLGANTGVFEEKVA